MQGGIRFACFAVAPSFPSPGFLGGKTHFSLLSGVIKRDINCLGSYRLELLGSQVISHCRGVKTQVEVRKLQVTGQLVTAKVRKHR